MLGMVHDSVKTTDTSHGPFDVDSDRSNFFVATVQHASREYFSRFLVFDTGPHSPTHVGTLRIGDYFINPVYHVPNGCANIVSASQLIDHGLKPHFKTDQFLLKGGVTKSLQHFPELESCF
ncbi:hypothetical protein PGTUg99_000111 [Puccinia graminis f. sp. tritici]|uniref:Uncharacterized protein n=1 Tax=Puccinia graminis f. sp. tritici TaxID=56615 RepID=A0A5B0RAB4_PUCGR|nr:hypothetical protein PGTUg99_000111 [Puccinia graminis f. sp. tritici]